MAVSANTLRSAEETDVKGKAVYVLHTWKDALWEMGTSKKADVPAPRELKTAVETEGDDSEDSPGDNHAGSGDGPSEANGQPAPQDAESAAAGAPSEATISANGTGEESSSSAKLTAEGTL